MLISVMRVGKGLATDFTFSFLIWHMFESEMSSGIGIVIKLSTASKTGKKVVTSFDDNIN